MPATPPAERPLLFVTGATGNLGRYLLPALRATGRYRLRLLYRPESGKDRVQGDDLEWVAGDLNDQYALEDAMPGCSACVHAAALVAVQSGRRVREALHRTNVEGTGNVINACLETGVNRLVYLSSVAALDRDRTGEPVDESKYRSDPKDAPTNYARSKVLAEREVWRGRAEGLSTAILYPSVILSEGDWDGGGPPGLWRRLDEISRYYPAGGTGLVAAADVARAVVSVLERGLDDDRFVLNAANWTYEKLFVAIAGSIGKPLPTSPLPETPAKLAAMWEDWRARLNATYHPRISADSLELARRTYAYDGGRYARETGNTYEDIDTIIQRIGAAYFERVVS